MFSTVNEHSMEYDMLMRIPREPQKNVFEISDVREETNKQTNKKQNKTKKTVHFDYFEIFKIKE